MTGDNHASEWNGRLATVIALALRDLDAGASTRARDELRRELAVFIAESGCSDELADTLVTTARLPRAERGSSDG